MVMSILNKKQLSLLNLSIDSNIIKIITYFVFFAFFAILSFIPFLINKNNYYSEKQYYPIIVIYNPDFYGLYKHNLLAFQYALKEEGVNFKTVDSYSFLLNYKLYLHDPYIKGLIFPDKINQFLPYDYYFVVKKFLEYGVNVFLSYDVGVKDRYDNYLKECIFSDLLGLNYITYEKKKENSYLLDQVRILEPKFLGFPTFRLDNDIIVGYKYTKKLYYVANVEKLNEKGLIVLAKTENYNLPFIVYKKYSNGILYYVNTPVGYLKANSDDLILRVNLKTFLYKICKISSVLNITGCKPCIIINYHLDSNIDWKSIEFLYNNGYFTKNIKNSFHITAGDFRDREGDGLGFDACGKGKKYVEIIKDYGEIGSHGGWAHNYFSYTILYNSERIDLHDFIRNYIKKNNECLESIVKYKIKEYSAPNGVYPQPISTKILEELGMNSYYYVGDLGSQPNLTFYNNQVVSNKVLAFPVIPYKTIVSLGEMKKRNVPEEEVENFLKSIIDYVIENETVRLYYTHPYDVLEYPNAYKKFLNYLELEIERGKIQTLTMDEYAKFFFRFLKTEFDIKQQQNSIFVSLYNNDSLEGISFRISKEEFGRLKINQKYLESKGVFFVKENDDYYYFMINSKRNFVLIILPRFR